MPSSTGSGTVASGDGGRWHAFGFVVAYVDYKSFYRSVFFPIIASDADPVTVKPAI